MASSGSVAEEFRNLILDSSVSNALFDEAEAIAIKMRSAKIKLHSYYDHAVLVCERALVVTSALEDLGYVVGCDDQLYRGRVDEHRYFGIAAGLPETAPAHRRGWFEWVLISQPSNQSALEHMQRSFETPHLHHVALSVAPPARGGCTDFEYAGRLVPEMVQMRNLVATLAGHPPQKLTISLPEEVVTDAAFKESFPRWIEGLNGASCRLEIMQGGGFMLQFPLSWSYRVEIVLRQGTRLAFNPQAAAKIADDDLTYVSNAEYFLG